jgi:arsenite methyltransferase
VREAIPSPTQPPAPARGTYGYDAPRLLVVPGLLVVLGVAQGVLTRSGWPFLGSTLVVGCVAIGYHSSRRGKFVVWSRLLDDLRWSGDEQVLDLGCGRGAVLILAAHHLTTGRAFGVDLWTAGQSGNTPAATMRNAAVEQVADRVEVITADMTQLPCPDATFDLVLSNCAVHNVGTPAAVDRVVDEAVRVLRPGGRLMIADLWWTRRYHRRLRAHGLHDITRRTLGWRMWWTGPWLPTHLVTATKAATTPHSPDRP